MPDEPQFLRELHELRERRYRERQGLSDEEYVAEINSRGEAIARKLGLRIAGPASRSEDERGNGAAPDVK